MIHEAHDRLVLCPAPLRTGAGLRLALLSSFGSASPAGLPEELAALLVNLHVGHDLCRSSRRPSSTCRRWNRAHGWRGDQQRGQRQERNDYASCELSLEVWSRNLFRRRFRRDRAQAWRGISGRRAGRRRRLPRAPGLVAVEEFVADARGLERGEIPRLACVRTAVHGEGAEHVGLWRRAAPRRTRPAFWMRSSCSRSAASAFS